jgi:hypothetical protein
VPRAHSLVAHSASPSRAEETKAPGLPTVPPTRFPLPRGGDNQLFLAVLNHPHLPTAGEASTVAAEGVKKTTPLPSAGEAGVPVRLRPSSFLAPVPCAGKWALGWGGDVRADSIAAFAGDKRGGTPDPAPCWIFHR